jgi:hypothetical protein
VLQCTLSFCGWRTLNHCNKFVAEFEILHSNHFRNCSKIRSLMYCKHSFNFAKNFCSMTCLYFSRLVPC